MSSAELGIALVASALGKKVPQKLSGRVSTGVSGCYVELASTRKKLRTPVSVAPPNSIDSDDQEHAEVGSEVPLSHSDGHIGLPGDAIETATNVGGGSGPTVVEVSDRLPGQGSTRPCAVENVAGGEIIIGERPAAQVAGEDSTAVLVTAMTEVAANEEVSDEPVTPGLISTPVPTSISEERILAEKDQQPRGNEVSTEQTGKAFQQKQKIANKQRMIREIAANQLLQEELAKHDPNLACVASFLSKVCGTGIETKKLQKAA